MSFKSISIPDAPLGSDVAADTPELHNQKNAMLRSASGLIAGVGIFLQNTPAGPRLRGRNVSKQVVVPILFGSPTLSQGEYNGQILIGNSTGMPPAGLSTSGQACLIENLPDATLSGVWPVPSMTYWVGFIMGSTTSGGMTVPVVWSICPPPDDCT